MISVIGKKTHGVFLDLGSPVDPKDKTFEQLCELLQQHFKAKRLEVAESYRFHRCFQEENETVSVYSARLRHPGVDLQIRGIPEPFSSVDSVSKNSAVSPSFGVNYRGSPPLRQGIRPNSLLPPQSSLYACFSCGNAGHVRSKCKVRNATCR